MAENEQEGKTGDFVLRWANFHALPFTEAKRQPL
jgi:hypothetical protein